MARETALGTLIRNQLGSDLNRRSLSRIGAFRTDADMPESLRRLLAEMDRAERTGSPARN